MAVAIVPTAIASTVTAVVATTVMAMTVVTVTLVAVVIVIVVMIMVRRFRGRHVTIIFRIANIPRGRTILHIVADAIHVP